jgi:uncharacterized tellurite resistance protein B-like protein
MIDIVKKIFIKKSSENRDLHPSQKADNQILVAACAILLEMAAIDGEFSDTEIKSIRSILKKESGLPEQEIISIVEISNNQRRESIDLWQFTNLINQEYPVEKKLRIIEAVWKIAYADGRLDSHEDYLAHKLANLLRLSHKQLIETKIKAKKEMEKNQIIRHGHDL